MEFLLSVGLRIRELRKKNKLTQEELALKVGYTSRSSINKIEKGIVDLPQSKIAEIAEALGTTPAYLMGWEDTSDTTPAIDGDTPAFSENKQALIDWAKTVPEDKAPAVLQALQTILEVMK